MLKRKIENLLNDWKKTPNHRPLIIKGQRQCGKTFSVLDFAKKNYKHVVYLNFFKNPNYNSIFECSLEINELIMMMSTVMESKVEFVPYETIIVFDEIQECPDARTALKFFKEDGRFDVIATGSLFGVKGYGKYPKSVPVGSETLLEMKPLDFEEFLWANGINEKMIDKLKEYLHNEKTIPEALHNKMM